MPTQFGLAYSRLSSQLGAKTGRRCANRPDSVLSITAAMFNYGFLIMNTDIPLLSSGFRRLYCDATVFDSLTAFHPVSFKRVLLFQSQDQRRSGCYAKPR